MSPADLPEVSVVVPVRDVEATIGSQLQALAGQSYDGEWELIIVDNGSSDGTQAVIEREGAAIPNLRVIDARDVDGVSAVRNQGIAVARGQFIVFCDGDDIADATWIEAMSNALDRSDAVAGAIRLDRINSPHLVEWRAQGLREGLNVWAGFLPWGISANFGAHAKALRAVGGFDDAIPGNCAEDVDLCWRLQLAGFTLSFAPLAVVDYRLRDDLRGSLEQAYRYARNEAFLYRRYRSVGMPRRPLGVVLKGWVWGVATLATARGRGARVRALRALAKGIGRLAGSLRYRVLYP